MFYIWHQLRDASLPVQILGALQLAFTVWMLVDASKRRVEHFWYWIIFIFQPIGPWVYFIAIKFPTLRTPRLKRAYSEERSLSLDELRSRVNRAPTVANRFALAEVLMEKGSYTEALPLLDAVLAIEPNYCAVLHARAVCLIATNAAEQAVAPLEKLLARDPRWENYRAWRTLVDVHAARGQTADALAACHELDKRMPTLEHKCLLARRLLDNGQASDAVNVLSAGLEDYRFSPWKMRWKNRRWAKLANRYLLEAGQREHSKAGLSTPNTAPHQ